MKNNKPTILTINPGTRYLGIAVFEGSDLIDWGVKVTGGKSAPDKLPKAVGIVSSLVTQYQPEVITMKQTHSSRTSPLLEELCRNIKCLSEEYHISLQSYSIERIGEFFGDGTRICSALVAEQITSQYPALARLLSRERNSSNHYHSRMFEAVALGIVCLNDTHRRHKAKFAAN